MQNFNLSCPNCGASLAIKQENCEFCDSPIIISSIDSLYNMSINDVSTYLKVYSNVELGDDADIDLSQGICYLKIRQYDSALKSFESIIANKIDMSEAYFYSAIALLKGNKAFKAKKSDIQKILSLLESACLIEDRAVYRCLLAYVKYDYFDRKFLPINPDYQLELVKADEMGYTHVDVVNLFSTLSVEVPNIYH
ncbi:hypothetical protein [Streptococcus sp.]|nr:hypothetical protein [Streptococcus sp.]MDY3823845.1 hypothetical protein [Streptococcus sp.]